MISLNEKGSQHFQIVLCWSLVTAFAAFSILRFLDATSWGIGFAPDSIQYIIDARSIISTKSLEQLGSHWPPLYQVLISFSSYFSNDLFISIKWLHISLYLINILLFCHIIWHHSNRSFAALLIGALVIATSTYFMRIHAITWSEPLFCLLVLLAVHFLAEFLTHNNIRILALSALFTGLACITRYAGIALLLSGVISILICSSERFKPKFLAITWFGFLGSAPLLIWIGRNLIKGQDATNREMIMHPIPWEKISGGIDVLLGWLFIPQPYGYLLAVIVLAIVIIYLVLTQTDSGQFRSKRILQISFVFIIVYISFLIVSISLFDSHTPLDYRILIPVYIFSMLPVTLLCSASMDSHRMRIIGLAIMLALVFLSWQQFKRQSEFVFHSEKYGIGFADRRWVKSETLSWLKELDHDLVVYTNGPEAVTLYTTLRAKMLPKHTNPGSREPAQDYHEHLQLMDEDLVSGNGIIVYFSFVTWRWYLPTFEQLNQNRQLRILFKSKDGIVLSH